jgi:hypothetical protein
MTTIEFNNRNFEALTVRTMTHRDMMLARSRSNDSFNKFARTNDGALWIWSDLDQVWKQIDFDPTMTW